MWFKFFDYYQGKLVLAAIVYLIFCCMDSHRVNQIIESINEENSSDYRKKKLPTAPYFSLIIVIIILVIALVSPMRIITSD